jgi:type IV pilus assembly protein PilM
MIGVSTQSSIFPPPNFLLLPAVGIDISDRSIKYAELIPRKGGYRLGRWGDVPLAPGIVEGGRIVSQPLLEEVLTNLRIKHGISFVRAALPEEQMYFFRLHIPDGPKDILRDTLELSLEEHVPILAAETLFDFEVISRSGGDAEVAVTAASRVVIESYSETFKNAGLTLLSLELEAEAVARAIVRNSDSFARLVVDFGETRTGIAINYGGHVQFTSTVNIGGQMLTETLAKHFSIPLAEAEKMKREFGLRRNSPNQDLFALLLNNVAVLRDEINRHFVYWHTHPDENGKQRPPIDEIILVGGDSNLAGLPDYLSASLHVKTTVADVWSNVSLPPQGVPDLSRNDSLGYATALGLALHDTNYE